MTDMPYVKKKSRLCELTNPHTGLRCVAEHYTLGMCRLHYRAHHKWGDPFHQVYGKGGKPTPKTPCVVIEAHTNEPCGRESFGTKEMCRGHYRRTAELAWDKDIGSRPLDAEAWQELYDRGMAHCSGPCDGYLPKSAFNADRRRQSGVQQRCKPCDKGTRAEVYASMPPEDKERLLEAARVKQAGYRVADPEKYLELGRARRAKMTDKDKAAQSAWAAQHYQKNKAEITAKQAAYYEANRDAAIERGRMERIRRKGVETDGHTCSVLHEYWEARGIDPKTCTYCDKHIRNWKTSEGDHVVPLIKGGTDFMENIVPCCGSCNSSKGDRILYVQWWPINMKQAA